MTKRQNSEVKLTGAWRKSTLIFNEGPSSETKCFPQNRNTEGDSSNNNGNKRAQTFPLIGFSNGVTFLLPSGVIIRFRSLV